mgnify:CR=1 FL=1
MRRTKIVATVGPATAAPGPLRELLLAGVDVVRLNAAHADMATHSANARRVRELSQALGRTVGILVDLPGPKIRSGVVAGDAVELISGQEFLLTDHDDGCGNEHRVGTTLANFAQWAQPGDDVYLADGAIVLASGQAEVGDAHHAPRGDVRQGDEIPLPRQARLDEHRGG